MEDGTTSASGNSLSLVVAKPGDLATVLEILEEARQGLIDRGILEQWPAPMPPEVFADRIARGEVYLAFSGSDRQAVGTVCLLRSDTKVWGDTPAEAAYVHGLAVRRSVAGRDIGASLLDLVDHVAAEIGLASVRLDCWAGNAALCRYYERLGFERRGERDLGGGFIVQRYERPISVPRS